MVWDCSLRLGTIYTITVGVVGEPRCQRLGVNDAELPSRPLEGPTLLQAGSSTSLNAVAPRSFLFIAPTSYAEYY